MTRERQRVLLAALIAASWANIVLLPYWSQIIDPERAAAQWLVPTATASYAALGAVAIVGVAGAVVSLIASRTNLPALASKLLAFVCTSAALFILLDAIRAAERTILKFPKLEAWAAGQPRLAVLTVVILAAVMRRWWRDIPRWFCRVLLVASPFLLITFGRTIAVTLSTNYSKLYARPAPLSMKATPGPRVITVVFDEMDYGIAFGHRPSTLSLAWFDQARREGFFATDVRPASLETRLAVPSLLTGRAVKSYGLISADTAMVRFRGDPTNHDLRVEPTIFDDAAAVGARSAIVGSYLPYCRWHLAALAQMCFTLPMWRAGVMSRDWSFPRAIAQQLLALGGPIAMRQSRISELKELADSADRIVADSTLRFIYIHLLVPHQPYVWNRRSGTYSTFRFRQAAYLDNLALADHILARLRSTVDRAGLSPTTTWVLTSDHGYRGASVAGVLPDHHSPLIVVFPSHDPLEWHEPIMEESLRGIIRGLLSGAITSPHDLAAAATPAPPALVVSR